VDDTYAINVAKTQYRGVLSAESYHPRVLRRHHAPFYEFWRMTGLSRDKSKSGGVWLSKKRVMS
jgi:hypothetical protein